MYKMFKIIVLRFSFISNLRQCINKCINKFDLILHFRFSLCPRLMVITTNHTSRQLNTCVQLAQQKPLKVLFFWYFPFVTSRSILLL